MAVHNELLQPVNERRMSHIAPRSLTADDFSYLMDQYGPWSEPPRCAVALSGGPDSVALAYLLDQWIKQRGGYLLALTVDHQLRVGSAAEAAQVKQWCDTLHIAHETLVWEKEKIPVSAYHQQARKARYELLIHACKAKNITLLFLGHHSDDQAETVLMRFIKGSGVDGLAGMPYKRMENGVTLLRPLLPVSKQALIHTCHDNGLIFFHDPSNNSQQFLRGRLRQIAKPLAQEGLDNSTLYDMARSAGTARAALEKITNEWLHTNAIISPLGIIQIDAAQWKMLDDEMKRRSLIRILLCMSGQDYPPRLASLDYLINEIQTLKSFHQTLCGCHILVQSGMITFYREQAAVADPAEFQDGMIWDERFKLTLPDGEDGRSYVVGPLGDASRATLEKMGYKQVADCPALHRASLPALYKGRSLHSVPKFLPPCNMNYDRQDTVNAVFFPARGLIIDCFETGPSYLF